MTKRSVCLALLFATLLLIAPAAFAQGSFGTTCNASVASAPFMRQEGNTEPAGDIFLSCSSGPSSGFATVTLVANAAITSRQLNMGVTSGAIPTEAALLINDCTSAGGTSISGANCAANGPFQGGNPIQGFLQPNGSLTFAGVSFPQGTSTLRITNLRLNANQLTSGAQAKAGLTALGMTLSNGGALTVGVVQQSLAVNVTSPVFILDQCKSQTTTVANFTFSEVYGSAFKSPNILPQNYQPGQWYQNGLNSESMFAFQGYAQAKWNDQLQIVPGMADNATRFRVNISAPAGLTLSVPTLIHSDGTGILTATSGGATGPFNPTPGASITFTGSTSIIYEVRAQSYDVIDSFTVPITVSYSGPPPTGSIQASVTYAPTTADLSTTSEGIPVIPNFVDTSANYVVAGVLPCLALTSLNPAMAPTGSSANLSVVGTGFTQNTFLVFNATPLTTTFVDGSHLTAIIPASLLTTPGQVQVFAAENARVPSNSLPFTITLGPTLTSLSPTSATAGGPQFTLTLNGTGFTADMQAYWNTIPLATAFVSANQLTATVPASLIAQPTTATITAQGSGGTTNGLPFTVSMQQLTLTSLSPNTAVAGGGPFTLLVNGTGFTSSTVIFWNTTALATTFISSSQVSVTVPPSLTPTVGTASVTAQNGQQVSNALPFTLTQLLTLTSLVPNTIVASSAQFSMTVNGTGFTSSTVIFLNSTALATTVINAGQAAAVVPANLILQPATDTVTAQNGQQVSNVLPFTITQQPLTLTSISPTAAVAGGANFNMTVFGTGFTNLTQVLWNGQQLATTFVSNLQLTAAVPASLIATAGNATVSVQNINQISNSLPFTIAPATPVLTSIVPTTAAAGGPGFFLTVTGSNFVGSTVVIFNGTQVSTTVSGSTSLTATIPANLILSPGMFSVVAQTGNLTSNALPFAITSATQLTLTNLSPNSVVAGSSPFTLTATGTGFTANTVLMFNSTALSTSFGSTTTLTATVPANLVATVGTASVTAVNGSQTSNSLPFTITSQTLTLTNLSPNSVVAGSSPFTLTATGTGFTANTVLMFNSTALSTSFGSTTTLTATVPANLVATVGTASVTAVNGSQTSNSLPFTITSQTLTLTNLSPNSAVAGSPAFTLTATGTGFTANTVLMFNSTALSTSFGSATTLTATVPASLVATVGTASVTAVNGSQTSNSLPFTITSQTLTLTNLSPNSVVAGSAAFMLTATGTGFTANTVLMFNSTALSTSFGSATTLTATVPANLVATVGTASVTAVNGSQTSNSLPFTITSGFTLISLSPSSAIAGSGGFTLSVSGTGFTANTAILWNGSALSSSFGNANSITASVPASLIATVGSATVTAQNGTQVSNGLTFSITGAPVTLISLSPSSSPAGSPQLTLTINGTGFLPPSGTQATWNGLPLSTQVISRNQISAIVPAALLANPGTAQVSVTGGPTPTSLPFTITGSLTLTSISPSTVAAGGPAFTLTANGSGFTAGSSITFNGTTLATSFVSSAQLTATVPAGLIVTPGTANIDVAVPGQTSPAPLPLLITPAITLTSLSPASAVVGGPAFTLTANGTGFVPGIVINFGSTPLITTYLSATQATGAVPANLIAQLGSVQVTVTATPPSSAPITSNAMAFNVVPPTPVITSLSPPTALAGGPAFTLTVNGSGFLSTSMVSSVVNWNGAALQTTFVRATQLTAAVSAALIAKPGNANVVVANGSINSNTAVFTITTPTPVITSISPASVAAGGPAFTLTVNGANFVSGAVVSLGSNALATNFVSDTQVTVSVPATAIAQPGSAQVTLANPTGPASNAVTLTITPLAPAITLISPASVAFGGPAFTLTINGTGFLSGAMAFLNSTPLSTTFVSGTQLTASVPANLIAQPGTPAITVSNSGGATSNAVNLTITAPAPTVTSINPTSVPPGGPSFVLTVTGTNFFSSSIVSLNGTALTTTFVSPTQLTAAVPANLVAQSGTLQVTVVNPGNASSNTVTLTVVGPAPTLTSISPTTVTQGGPAFTLTVNGTNFVSGAVVSLGPAALATTFVSATQVTAAVPANLIQQPGPQPVTVSNPGSVPSNPLPLTVNPPVPTITSLSPSMIPAGGPAFTLTVNGTNFLTGAVVFLNGNPLNTTFVSATQITAQVPPNQIVQPGNAQITVANMGGQQSIAATLTVTPPAPAITNLSPASANVGDPTFTLTVTGTGFAPASIVQWNGAPLSTTVVSPTQLTATVDSGRLIQPGTASVTAVNPGPNGTPLVSNALTFTINPVTPAISSISPNSATAAGPAFSLTVNGTGFLTLTTINWSSTALTTHFVSATQLTADVPASLLTLPGTVSITAVNPGSTSNAVTFTINPPQPAVLTSLSKTTATAGDAAFTLTVNGTGFMSGAVVNFGTTALATTFVSSTQLNAAVTASLLLTPGTVQVTVVQGGVASNVLSFTISLPAAPSLRLTPPANLGPNQQPIIDFGLNSPYPLPLSGTITLTFASNATVPSDDPMIQFASGGRTFSFTVPANTTTLPTIQIATGTVAGTITLTVSLTTSGVNVTPSSGSTATIVIPKSAPVILPGKITVVRANGYLEVDVTGFSTTRDMTQAVFHLNATPGGSFTSTDITVPVSSLFTTWFQSAASMQFGGQFTYVQEFTVIGDVSEVQSVTVTLTNSAGASVSATSN